MHTRPRGLHATREPIQIGAEIYGHAGLEADLEIQELMLDALHLAGLSRIRLDLCHAGVLAALLARDAQAAARGEALYDALSGKDVPLLHELTDDLGADTRALRALPHLYGDASVLDEARRGCPCCRKSRARWTISRSSRRARRASKSPSISPICAAMLSQRRMFTAYVDGVPNAMARGGRYDQVGRHTAGRARRRVSRSTCASSRGFPGRGARHRDSRALGAGRCTQRGRRRCAMRARS
jgi:ATP phosphoribosyltransferase regulatory subunit